MKKRVFALFSLILVVSSLIFPVSAQYYSNFYSGTDRALSWIQNTAGPVFGVFLGGTGELLFERVLLFFILIALVFIILSKMKLFKENMVIIWIITLAVSLLATRFLSDSTLVQNVLLPYTILGVALTAAIPFIIYFFFVESFEDSSTLRKILWIFFIVVFLGIWADRQSELGELSYIYILTGLIALICLLFDGTIRRVLWKDKQRALGAQNAEEAARKIGNLMYELNHDYNVRKSVTKEFYEKERRRLEKARRDAYKF